MIIDIILPHKEDFSNAKASAVSLTIKNSAEFSKFKSKINVFGQKTDQPFKDLKFTGFKTNKILHLGNNRSIFINYLKKNNFNSKDKRIIEMHNRPYVFNYAIKKLKYTPITLHFHNDPRNMKGSKSIAERIRIANHASAVYFVSEYIKNCFLDGIEKKFTNLYVIPNGIQRTLTRKPKKDKLVVFVGRLVKEKGCHLYVKSIKKIVQKKPEWSFKIIGTPKAGQSRIESTYARNLINDFENLGNNTEYLGFITNSKVKEILEKTSILIVPSIWQEPFALTALEGMCNGVAVIASKVGGMGEMLEDIGLLIDDIDENKLEKSIKKLIENKDLLNEFQNKSWTKYNFNQSEIVKKQDSIREDIFQNYNFINSG